MHCCAAFTLSLDLTSYWHPFLLCLTHTWLIAGPASNAVFPSNPSPAYSGMSCNQYLPSNTMDRFLWVINYFATNGFYVVSTPLYQHCYHASGGLQSKSGFAWGSRDWVTCDVKYCGGWFCSHLSCIQFGTITNLVTNFATHLKEYATRAHMSMCINQILAGWIMSWSHMHAHCILNITCTTFLVASQAYILQVL